MKLKVCKTAEGYAVLTNETGVMLPAQVRSEIISDGGELGGRLIVEFSLAGSDIEFSDIKPTLT
jgi:hypothetical protein